MHTYPYMVARCPVRRHCCISRVRLSLVMYVYLRSETNQLLFPLCQLPDFSLSREEREHRVEQSESRGSTRDPFEISAADSWCESPQAPECICTGVTIGRGCHGIRRGSVLLSGGHKDERKEKQNSTCIFATVACLRAGSRTGLSLRVILVPYISPCT
jgi:hypothetical protein